MLSEKERISRMNVPPERIRLVIDSDAKNEVDDQFAIAWAAACPDRFQLEALYAVPFSHDCFQRLNQDQETVNRAGSLNGHSENPADGMEQSYQEMRRILTLMGRENEVPVFRGSDRYLPDARTPVDSPATRDLIRRCMVSAEPVYVAAIGALSNIASALLLVPEIADRMVLVWLGGHMQAFGHGIEFNLIQDVRAAQIVFDSGVPMIWIPCNNVATHLIVSEAELRAFLAGSGPLCNMLCEEVFSTFRDSEAEIAMMKLLRTSSLAENMDQDETYLDQFPTKQVAWSRVIWDISAIAALKNPNWTPSRLIRTPRLMDDFRWEAGGSDRHWIRQVTYCYRNLIFGDLFASLSGR